MTTPAPKPLRVFCSYSHRDEEYLNELRTWLRGLERQGLIEWWHDRQIPPGWEWEEAIDKNLRIAEVILLLVTPDFMASDYVYEKEIDRAIERHKQGKARVIPIILRPALWKWASFGNLQALPKDAKPITTWTNQDQAWLDVVKGIRKAVGEFLLERQKRLVCEERYREAVEEAWTDEWLSDVKAEQLGTLVIELGLSTDTAADIEHRIMGATREAILKRQERAAREKVRTELLEKLYARARGLLRDREWQKVVDLFEQIYAEDPNYPDPEGFLASARNALKLEQRVAETYDRGLRHIDAEEWPQAARCFEEVQQIEPEYRDNEKLLARVREELATRTPTSRLDSRSATRWEYTDFDLEIHQQSEPRKYLVAARTSGGEVQQEMHFPFDERELKDKLRDLEVALLRSGGTRRRFSTREEQAVQDFGKALFEALLIGKMRAHYEESLREARLQNKGLRLKLHVQPPELSALPWEFLYDPKRDYLGLSSMTPLVRYMDAPQPAERLTVTLPLRILGMVASPQGLPQLDVEREMRLVEEAVEEVRAQGLVELTWLQGQTWRDLQRAMRREEDWHIFHFVGHGGFDPETEEGAIALADEGGHKDLLRGTALARLLDDHFPLRLVFLNSCEGAKGSESEAFSSTAATLVRRGVPAVVAMQYEVTDKAAIEFSRNFYEAVADGLPVDAAVAEARTAVSMSSALEWGTPVLYMRTSDGRIFDVKQTGDRPGGNEPKPGRFKTLPGWEPGSTASLAPGGKEPKPGRFKTLPGW